MSQIVSSPYTILLALCGFLSYKLLCTALFTPLSAIPNAHFSAPFSRLWLLWIKWTVKENRTRSAAHKRLGPVIRLGPHELSVNCMENGVQTIYGGNFDKSTWYANFESYGHRVMFSMLEAKPHAERKRLLAHVYSKSYIQNSTDLTESLRAIVYSTLMPRIRAWANDGATVDVHELNKCYNMDTMTAYIFGLTNSTKFIEKADIKTLQAFVVTQNMNNTFWWIEFPRLTAWMGRLGVQLVPGKVSESLHHLEGLCSMLSQGARETMSANLSKTSKVEKTTYPVVYGHFYRKLEDLNTAGDSIDSIAAGEVLDHLHAGHATTGVTLTYLMWELSKQPLLQTKLRTELATLSHPELWISSPQLMDSLPLLDAVLLETLRFHPGFLGPFPRVVPPEGARIGDFSNVPSGTIVSTSPLALQRNPVVYSEPEKWLPERWIDASGAAKKEMDKWLWTFGSGGRMCTGNHVAIRVMKTFIAAVYMDFQTTIMKETNMEQADNLMGEPLGEHLFLRFHHVTSISAK